jgi:hypothetical protein
MMLALVFALSGCRARTPATAPALPDATWFDNSLHLDLENERFWGRQDEENLLRQLGYADVVAVGSIQSIGLASHYGAERHLNLAFRPDELLHGTLDQELDRDRQLVVRIAASAEAFEIARRVPQWNSSVRFLLVLKHQCAREGGPGARRALERSDQGHCGLRWAIYLPTARMLARVRTLFSRLREQRLGSRAAPGSG